MILSGYFKFVILENEKIEIPVGLCYTKHKRLGFGDKSINSLNGRKTAENV